MKGTLISRSKSNGVSAAKINLTGLAKGVYVARSGMEAVPVIIW